VRGEGKETYDDETDQDADDGGDPGPGEKEEADDGDQSDTEETEVDVDGEAVGTKVVDHLADEFHLAVVAWIWV
jgi:hypothetical protein